MDEPLVSIICLCYNHEQFVRQSVESAVNQSHRNIEIIIIDDKSTDRSPEIINKLGKEYPQIKVILLNENVGNTKAFNRGLSIAGGEFIIDLSTDDLLHTDRVKAGLEAFKQHDEGYGVNFTNAAIIDENSTVKSYHYPIDSNQNAITEPPQGDLYIELIRKYFICSPTMMIKRQVLNELGGYDENLTYEDFDFWVRSARKYKYCYTDKVLVLRRRIDKSMSTKHYGFKSEQMKSTFIICQKIKALNKTKKEGKALKRRIYIEIKQCIKYLNLYLLMRYLIMYVKV